MTLVHQRNRMPDTDTKSELTCTGHLESSETNNSERVAKLGQ